MTLKALLVSVGLAVVWTAALLYVFTSPIKPPELTPETAAPRHFVIHSGRDAYSIQADEAREIECCTVFIRDGVAIAGVCEQHTWSEEVE